MLLGMFYSIDYFIGCWRGGGRRGGEGGGGGRCGELLLWLLSRGPSYHAAVLQNGPLPVYSSWRLCFVWSGILFWARKPFFYVLGLKY
jgi:hypothetical protein